MTTRDVVEQNKMTTNMNNKQQLSIHAKNIPCNIDLIQKGMTKWNFAKSNISWNMFPDSKQDIRKPWELHSVLRK